MKFKQFCINIANPDHIDIPTTSTTSYEPDKMYENIINIMKPKMDILDKINVPFIEATFEDMDEVVTLLENNSSDISDGMILRLAENLYENHFNNLNDEEQAIIKVIACYLSIQSIIRRN